MRWLAGLLVAAALLVPAAAVAKTPLPKAPQGSGHEATAGGGTVAGAPFRARSAFVGHDAGGGDLHLYLFAKPVSCRVVGYDEAPYVWVIVHTEGTPPVVGKPSLSNGRDIVQVNFTLKDHYISVTPGVRLVFTRVDPAKGGVWHGSLSVRKLTYEGRVFSYAGTFAARWCG